MSGKQLTYHQFKQIANTLGDKASDPREVANVSGLTDVDYDLLHEYLLKWQDEKAKDINTDSSEPSESSEPSLASNSITKLEKKSLMALFRSTLESSNDGILIIDNNGKLIDWNDKFFEIAGIPPSALEQASEEIGLEYIFNQVKDPQKLMIELGRLEEENSMKGDFGEVEFLDGRTIERYTQPLILDNKPVGRVWCFKDITLEKERKNRINILTSAIQSATQGILVLDHENIVYINDYLKVMLGLENLDSSVINIKQLGNERLEQFYSRINQLITNNNIENKIAITDNSNTIRWFELSAFKSEYNDKHYTLGIINDVTQSKLLQDQITYNAYHDLLTGLPNRNKILSVLRQKIISKDNFAVYFVDLDNFKLINDSLGHAIGDKLLTEFGKKLEAKVCKGNMVGRLGGDEFIVIVNDISLQEDNQPHIDVIKSIIAEPIKVNEYEFNITLTMGIAMYPIDAATPEDLIKNADSAMYQKKMHGKNGIAFYDSKIRTMNMRKITIANKIYKAIENEELSLHYQPIYDLKTQAISSVETLLRWNNHELGGFVPPDEFIGVTEEVGYIDTLTYWVFENSLKQLKRWHDNGYNKLRMTLNLSGALLYNPGIISNISNIITSSNILPQYITIELTENVFINDSRDIIEMLNKLSKLGLKIAIDDFGTGYSSFAYLQQLPINVIKIDKMFTQCLFEKANKENRAIILSIIELGKHAGYDIIAEGVETINQMQFLQEHNCTYGQGYHFSRPIPHKDMEKLLQENSMWQNNNNTKM